MELILAFMLAPLVVSLIIPRVWLVPYGLLIFFGIAYLWFDESWAQCAACGGPGSALGVAFFALAVVGFVIGMFVRGLIAFHKAVPAPSALQARWATAAIWALLSGAFALFATALAVIFLNRVFDSGLLTHLGICLLALAWFCWAPIFWREDGGIKTVRHAMLHPCSVVRWTGAVVIVLLMAWSVRTISFTIDAAESVADGRPYCINTSTAKGLRRARTYWDLSGFLMQADRLRCAMRRWLPAMCGRQIGFTGRTGIGRLNRTSWGGRYLANHRPALPKTCPQCSLLRQEIQARRFGWRAANGVFRLHTGAAVPTGHQS
ncbi:hypothetical protein LP414_31245 [Polaromonas sp. P1(28)-13]|nr:hypothetical protein LP414_31245 [Polaromonas sp. P1(28)-13]